MSSNVRRKHVAFSFGHLSTEFLTALLPSLHTVTDLTLDFTNITTLPSCINACRSLKKLALNYCKKLREIRELPPNLKYLEASACDSLTSESKEMLLEQALLNPNSMVKYISFPGSTIPRGLNQCRSKPSLSFLFRNKFPTIALFVVGVLSNFYHYFSFEFEFEFDLIINGSQRLPNFLCVSWSKNELLLSIRKHIILLDLKFKSGLDMIGGLHFENGRNHAEISLVRKGGTVDVKWMRVHVGEQQTNMADIQIINPAVPIVGEENENVTRGDERPRKKVKSAVAIRFWRLPKPLCRGCNCGFGPLFKTLILGWGQQETWNFSN